MSIQAFIDNPKAYCESHVVQFTHGAFPPSQAGMQVASAQHFGGNWSIEEHVRMPGLFTDFEFIEAKKQAADGSGAFFVQVGKGNSTMHTVVPTAGAVDKGIRYLPWKADCVTYMSLDNAATTFFTGPLSGCSIYVGRALGGAIWTFHANRNNSGTANNAAVKTAMTNAVLGRLPVRVNLIHSAVYGQQYTDFGFVFGRRRPDGWKFYAVNTALRNTPGSFRVTQMKLP